MASRLLNIVKFPMVYLNFKFQRINSKRECYPVISENFTLQINELPFLPMLSALFLILL
jgi:hypothetical protein